MASDFFHAFKEKIFIKEVKNIISFRFMQFYGTYLGHKQKGTITKELKNRFYYPNNLSSKSINNEHQSRVSLSKKIDYH
jgi:rhamnosyltransferase